MMTSQLIWTHLLETKWPSAERVQFINVFARGRGAWIAAHVDFC